MPRNRYSYDLPEHHVEYGVMCRVDELKIDPQAQRTVNEKRAQQIAKQLVREALGSIVVSERENGDRYVVDGQHRRRVCELESIDQITAEIHYGLTQQEEAVLFLIKNRESSKPSAFDEYKVGLTAGLPLFVDTDKVLKAHGLEMGATSANSIGAVAGVLRITDHFGPEILDRTLHVAELAWGRSAASWDGMILGGIGMFLGRHGELVEDEELAMKMAKKSHAQGWVGLVHSLSTGGGTHNSGTGSRVSTCYQQILEIWNKGRRKNKIMVAA